MIKEILNKLSRKEDLSNQEMQDVVNHIMCGEVEDNDIESFLLALNEKGIQEPEITAAATVMRDKSLKFDIGDGTHIDTCGTGGTGLHTFNCSTASSFVAAAGGASITKHGNKAISSKSGSADFLTEAGADITHDRNKLLNVFNQVGFIFLFAPLHHESMKYVMPARQRIGKKTIFNLLVPLTLGLANAAPNIVMFLTDDQDLVLNGLEPMPKTREWFSGGQIFENAFVSTPVCCPSRSSLLTGRYQHNTKVVNNSVAGNCYGEEWRSESGLEARCVYCFQEKKLPSALLLDTVWPVRRIFLIF